LCRKERKKRNGLVKMERHYMYFNSFLGRRRKGSILAYIGSHKKKHKKKGTDREK